jgi:hypothetical protein
MNKTVILLHGLLASPLTMKYIESKLKTSGYLVYNFKYNSQKYSTTTLHDLHTFIQSIPSQNISLIGHSMGGLVARNYINQYFSINSFQNKIKNIITIATPHNQSACAHIVSKSWFKKHLGTAGNSGLTIKIAEWDNVIPMGCIAGTSTSKLNANLFLSFHPKKEPNDGTVFINEAILKNCNDHIIIQGSHTGLLLKKEVAQQCIYFLEHTVFEKQQSY